MKTRSLYQFFALVVLALGLVLLMVATAGAAEPREQGVPWLTQTPWPTPRVLQVGERFSLATGVIALPTLPSAPAPRALAVPHNLPAPAPRMPAPTLLPVAPVPAQPPVAAALARDGATPERALVADGAARTLAAGASVWYLVGHGGQHIDVFLDAQPLSGMSFAVFAPGNLSNPIGQGTLQPSSGRLVWAGGHWRSQGDWFARVTNHNSMTVQYRVTTSARDISNKSCYSYWEYYQTGAYVYWTECQ